MSDNTPTCPSCGARVAPDATQCDLCGVSLSEDESLEASRPSPDDSEKNISGSDEGPIESPAPDDASEPSPELSSVYCNQCGWENPEGARYCSRCGEQLQEVTPEETPAGTRRVTADLPTTAEADPQPDRESSPSSNAEDPTDPQRAMGQQITLLVGGALALVVVLFFATRWSQQYDWGGQEGSSQSSSQQQEVAPQGGEGGDAPNAGGGGGNAPNAGGGGGNAPNAGGGGGNAPMAGGGGTGDGATSSSESAEPTDLSTLVDESGEDLEGDVADQVDSLRAAVENAEGEEEQQIKAEIANLLIGAGAPGQAAAVQTEIADETGAVDDRRRAADLLYRWMQKLQGEGDRGQALEVARHVAEAYGAVSDERPDDLDARTRMGEAYLLTNSPMRGIRAINAVVDEDSTFVPARFQKGLALLQINRLDQALREFASVQRHASEDDPFYNQAERAIEVIQEQESGGSGESAPQPSPEPSQQP